MDDQLTKSTQDGNIEALYSILTQDPFILERIDQRPIVHTPLHMAAASGNTHFAMELATLKPSFARKLNHRGLSPIHLALENGHDQFVRSIMTVDSELVRVKAKGRITPLHYVAEMENVDLLAEFLSACPSCIEDLTSLCETAVHVAVKNKKFGAFKVLFGWLRRVNKDEILNWKDEDGNTVLHIAVSTNQPEVVKLLIKNVNKNVNNLSGLTAMDMFDLEKDLLDEEVGKILRKAKAKKASELTDEKTLTLANYLSRDLLLIEKRDKFFRTMSQSNNKSHSDLRNYVLVVAILIATATYQAVLSPPGGFWQDTYIPKENNSTNAAQIIGNNTTTSQEIERPHQAGQIIMGPYHLFTFFTLNTLAFYMSAATILIVMLGLPYCRILSLSVYLLMLGYHFAVVATIPTEPSKSVMFGGFFFTTLISFCMLTTWTALLSAFATHTKIQDRIDSPKRHLGELI